MNKMKKINLIILFYSLNTIKYLHVMKLKKTIIIFIDIFKVKNMNLLKKKF